MDTPPQPLPYARPDVNRPPPDDREVRVGGVLQLVLSIPCVISQVQTWLAPPRPLAASVPHLLAFVGFTLAYPTLAFIVVAGSLGRHRGLRRRLYGIYMAGTAVLVAAATAAALLSTPTSPPEPVWLRLGGLMLLLFLNPAAVWIGGRWVIFRLFPSRRHGSHVA